MNKENNSGFIYCLYNPIYKTYGNNIYKLGHTKNLNKRLNQYKTGYLEKSEYLLTSSKLQNRILGETMLFNELVKYRMNTHREFFNCDIKIIKETFEKIEKYFNLVESNNTSKITENNNTTEINNMSIKMKNNICDICNKKYKSYQSLWNHNKKFHEKLEKKIEYTCNICSKIFDNRHKKFYHQKKCNKQNILDK
jgi:hypothetical protein